MANGSVGSVGLAVWLASALGGAVRAAELPDGSRPEVVTRLAGAESIHQDDAFHLHASAEVRAPGMLAGPEKLFAWRVDGGAWSGPVTDPDLEFSGERLGLGRHQIEVRAVDSGGRPQGPAAAWEVDVRPIPLQERGWFLPGLLSVLGLLLSLAVVAVRARLRLAEYARTLEEKVARRTADLEADIQRRQLLEQSLRTSEERFLKVFECSPVLATISSPRDGTVLDANRNFCAAFGYRREELIGRSTVALGIWKDPARRAELMVRLAAGDPVLNEEIVCRQRDGKERSILVSIERVQVGDEAMLLIFGVDISERRALENQLRHLADNLPGSYVFQYALETDGSARFLQLSAGVEKCHGVEAAAAVADPAILFALVHPGHAGALQDAIAESARSLGDFAVELLGRRGDGSWGWFRFASRPQREPSGRIVWDGVATDITARKEVELSLQVSERRFAQAFQSNPMLAAISSLVDHRLIDCNDRLCRFTGLSRGQLLGHSPRELGLWVDLTVRDRLVQRLIADEVVQNEAVEMRNSAGEVRRLLVSAQRIDLGGEPAALFLSADVTEQSRRDEALAASEERFRTLVEQSADGIFVADGDGRYEEVNTAGCEILGYTRDELCQLRIADVLAPEDHVRLPAHQAAVQAGAVARGEWRLRRKDGSGMVAELSVRRLPGGRSLAVLRDVTERRRAEEKLRFNEAVLRETGAIAKVGGWQFELATGVTYWTDEVARIHGREPGTTASLEVGLNPYAPESRARIEAAMHRAATLGEEYDLEAEVSPDGNGSRWVRILGRPVRENGVIVRLQGSIQDITERKVAEVRLRESEQRFATIFWNSPVVAVITGHPDGRYLDVNHYFTRILGFQREEALGRRALDLGVWADPAQRREVIHRIDGGEVVRDFDCLLRAKSGEVRNMSASVDRLVLGGQDCLIFIATDTTERRLAEESLRQSEQTLAALFEGIRDGIVVADAVSRRFLRVNESICEMTGYDSAELLELGVDQFHPPDSLEYVNAEFGKQLAGEIALSPAMPVRRKDGSVFFADVTAAPMDVEGRRCLVGVFRDVSDRLQAEDSLRQSEGTLNAIFGGIREGILISDRASRQIIRANPGMGELMGYPAAELLALRIEDLHPPEQAELVRHDFALQGSGERRGAMDLPMRRKDGSEFFADITTRLLEVDGRPCVLAVFRDATERRETEKALREQLRLQERLASLALTVPGALFVFEALPEGVRRVAEAGPKLKELTGLAPAELAQDVSPLFRQVHPADYSRTVALIEESVARRLPWHDVFRIQHPAKGTVWLEGFAQPAGGDQGPAVWHGILLDVTDRLHGERRRSTEHAVSQALAGAGTLAATYVGVLAALCQGEGWEYGELWGVDPVDGKLNCLELWHEDSPQFDALAHQTRQVRFGPGEGLPGRVWQAGEAEVIRELASDAGFRRTRAALAAGLVSALAFPIYSGKRITGIMAFMTCQPLEPEPGLLAMLKTIGTQVGQFMARKTLQEELRRFVSLSPSVIYALRITPFGMRAYWVSDNLHNLTGYAPGEPIHGSWWSDHLHPADRDRVFKANPTPYEIDHQVMEFRFRRKDGEYVWLRDEKRLVRDAQGRPAEVIGAWTDISDRRSLETQLLQAQKMEAIGHLSGGIAHDFNNILGAIIGNAQLAELDLPPEHPAAESVGQILKASQRATHLVRQILTFARQNSQERHRVDLQPVVEESVRLLRSTIPTVITIQLHVAEGPLPLVLADETQVQQVILNLGTNSWHATESPTGLIDVELTAESVSAAQAAQNADLHPGRYLRLRVRDTGKGMGPELIARIFEPFFTTKEPGKGTGLGLSVVHGIMKSHEGAIVVESVLGVGTTFDLYFPEAGGTGAGAAAGGKAERRQGAGQRILLVDDEETMLRATHRVLERLGYRVTSCAGGGSAILAFLAEPAAFALVLTDLNMPGMSGIEVAAALRKTRTDLPVVLSSGFITEDLRLAAEAAGVAEIVRKPASMEDLSEAVFRTLQRQP